MSDALILLCVAFMLYKLIALSTDAINNYAQKRIKEGENR